MFETGPTAGEMAYGAAQDNAIDVQDCLVIIGWLAERVARLELSPGLSHDPLPELPSAMQGFACLPRRSDAVKAAIAKLR